MIKAATHCGYCGNAYTTTDPACPGCGELKTAETGRGDLTQRRKLEAFDPRDALPQYRRKLSDNNFWSFVLNVSAIASVPAAYVAIMYAQIYFPDSAAISSGMLVIGILGIGWLCMTWFGND